jgi:FAD/FMN-containing dehydrogenase
MGGDGKVHLGRRSGGEAILSAQDQDAMRGTIGARIIMPGDDDYDTARMVWNGLIDKHPGVIVRCRSAADVVSAVNFARKNDFRVSVRGGGHNVAGRAIAENGIVIDLSAMRGVIVDAKTGNVRAQAGALLADLDEATHEHGLAVPAGVVSATGVAGLTLGGGYGWLARGYGLTIDNCIGAEIVTADGAMQRVDRATRPDLFWALCGGGASLGVVTSFEFQAHPIPPKVWFAMPIYAMDDAEAALRNLRTFIPGAPDKLSILAALWSAPDDPAIDAAIRGQPALYVLGCYSGRFDEGEKAIEPLRTLAEPQEDLSVAAPFVEVQKLLDNDYPDGRRYYWKSHHFGQLSDDCIDTMVALARERPSALSSLDLWVLGGQIAAADPDASAFAHRQAPLMLNIESNWNAPAEDEHNIQWTRYAWERLERFSSGGMYVNFGGLDTDREQLSRRAFGEHREKLVKVKQKYDPDNLFEGTVSLR